MTTDAAPTTAHAGVIGRLPFRSLIGYGAGDFANNLAFSLGAAFLLYYYTDIAGISAAAVGTMFLVVRLWDAFTDIFAGRVVDRTATRWGKFRPFILFGAIPLLFLSFLCFHVPGGASNGTKILYMYLTYAALGLVYSLVNIPYGSLASAMSQDVKERAKLVSARSIGTAIAAVGLTFLIAPKISDLQKQKKHLSSEEYLHRAQSIFTQTTLLFIVIGTVAYALVFFCCKEKVVRRHASVSLKDTFATLKRNKPLAYLCGASFCYLTGMFAVMGVQAFYAQYVLGDVSYTMWMALVSTGIAFVATPFVPMLVGRWGKKNLFMACGGLTFVGGVALFLTPNHTLGLSLLFLGVAGIGQSIINTTMFGLEADTVEYGEWKSGQRSEGATYAIFSFTRKLTQSLGGFLGAWLLAAGHYVSASGGNSSPAQPDSAILMIKVTIGLVPAVAAVLAILIFRKYPLTDTLFATIRDENERRKRAEQDLPVVDRPAAGRAPATATDPAVFG